MTLLMFLKPHYQSVYGGESKRQAKKERRKLHRARPKLPTPPLTLVRFDDTAERLAREAALAALEARDQAITDEISKLRGYLLELEATRQRNFLIRAAEGRRILAEIQRKERERQKNEAEAEALLKILLEIDD